VIPFSNILLIKLKHLGDVLTTTPLIEGIVRNWPEARITYLVNPGGEDLVRYHPRVHDVLALPRHQGLVDQLRFIRDLRRRRFDLAIELSEGDRGAFLSWISNAGVRVGYQPARKRLFDRRRLFTHLVTTRSVELHTVLFHLETLNVLGVDPGRPDMSLYWPPQAAREVKRLLNEGGIDENQPYAVVHPSSRWMFKTWRPEGNADVIDYLDRELGLRVVMTAAPEEKELAFTRQVLQHVRTRPLDLTGRLQLTELAALINGARMFFGVDSLPMHMAAAVGTPAVALFGPSGEMHWAPWGRGHHVIAKDWPCRPCGRDGCFGSKISRCLVEIEPEDVYPAFQQILEARP
jgi:heptosyltransferase III